MVFTIWEPYIYYEGLEIINAIHIYPIILVLRPKVTSCNGIDMSTRPNSTIVINPPLPQVASLKLWCEENISHIQKVINDKLYEKNKQNVLPPVSTEIRLITQVLGSANLVMSPCSFIQFT